MGDDAGGAGAREISRAISAQARARWLAQAVADQAGRIAETVSELARIRDEVAEGSRSSARADEASESAARARRFADHERREQQRWGKLGEPK